MEPLPRDSIYLLSQLGTPASYAKGYELCFVTVQTLKLIPRN